VFCYNSSSHPDSMTALLRSHAEHWIEVEPLEDAAFAERVLQDELDILVDLSGHTSNGRIHAMQPRIAAVQATWLGYFSTTGLPAMDYLISDPVTSPPGSDSLYTEHVLRMPHSRFVFVAPDYMPAVNALPSQAARQPQAFTFGSLNNLSKVTPAVLDAWAEVLHQVAGSRLLLRTLALGQASGRERIQRAFQERGIDAQRLMLLPNVGGEEAMRSYHQIDLALDPFPFTGGMTSFEALWMGVPIVTLPGESMVSRQTLALLHCLGDDMLEFVANSPADYVARCVHWATQPQRLQQLQQLRQSLRERLLESPLTDYPEFTRALENLYRQMLQQPPD
jgi:predicted O-linked N-acetylglucosamine transferase (SPINDLY family)